MVNGGQTHFENRHNLVQEYVVINYFDVKSYNICLELLTKGCTSDILK